MTLQTKFKIGDIIEYSRGKKTYHGTILEINVRVFYGDYTEVRYTVDPHVGSRKHSVLEQDASEPKLAT